MTFRFPQSDYTGVGSRKVSGVSAHEKQPVGPVDCQGSCRQTGYCDLLVTLGYPLRAALGAKVDDLDLKLGVSWWRLPFVGGNIIHTTRATEMIQKLQGLRPRDAGLTAEFDSKSTRKGGQREPPP